MADTPRVPPTLEHTFRGHQGAIYAVTWHAKTQSWVTAAGDGIVARWTPGAEDAVALAQHNGAFFSVASLGSWGVLAGHATGEVLLVGGTAPQTLRGHEASVYAIRVSGDGHFWSGDGQGVVKQWALDGHTGRATCLWTSRTDLGKVRHLGHHPEGLLVATGSGAWAVLGAGGQVLHVSHCHRRSCYWAWWHPQKNVVLSTGQDGELVVSDATRVHLERPLHLGAIYRGCVEDGTLWTASRDKSIKAWSVDTLDARTRLDRAHTRSVNALALGGPSGTNLATAGDDRTLKVWS